MAEQSSEIGEVAKNTGGQITEKTTGNKFLEFIHKHDPMYTREFDVPGILDHEIKQENGIRVTLKGPKENLQVQCQTPKEAFLLNNLAPEGTVFEIRDDNGGFKYSGLSDTGKISIPRNVGLWKHPMRGLMHEMCHLWMLQDPEWARAALEAEDSLGPERLRNTVELQLPGDQMERQKIENARKILSEGQRKAMEVELYMIGRLRSFGVDIFPQYPNAESLLGLVNGDIKSEQESNQWLTMSKNEAEDLTKGKLPYPALKEKIDVRLAKLPVKPLAMPAS